LNNSSIVEPGNHENDVSLIETKNMKEFKTMSATKSYTNWTERPEFKGLYTFRHGATSNDGTQVMLVGDGGLCLVSPFGNEGEWKKIDTGGFGRIIDSVVWIEDAKHFAMVGHDGFSAIYDESGIKITFLQNTTNTECAIACNVNKKIVCAAGVSRVDISTDYGKTYVSADISGYENIEWRKVTAYNNGFIVVGAAGSTAFVTENAGKWKLSATPFTFPDVALKAGIIGQPNLYSIAVFKNGKIGIGGQNNFWYLFDSKGNRIPDTLESNGYFWDTTFDCNDTLWVCGNMSTNTLDSFIAYSNDGVNFVEEKLATGIVIDYQRSMFSLIAVPISTTKTRLIMSGAAGEQWAKDIDKKDVVVLPPVVLNSPVALPATNITKNSFTANWGKVDNATGYKIICGENVIDAGNVNTYTISSLTPKTTYTYKVKAYNATISSVDSNVITVTTLEEPVIVNPTIGETITIVSDTDEVVGTLTLNTGFKTK
jgi:hypothetical protein